MKIPEVLVSTWQEILGGRPPSAESLVRVVFRDVGGGTEVTLTPTEDVLETARREHEQVWRGCFDRLTRVVA